jgi:hypothetical protein
VRKTLYRLLVTEVTEVTWFERGAVIDVPSPPFAVIGYSPPILKNGGRYVPVVEIAVHDERGDYGRIESIHKSIREVLEGVVQCQLEDGIITTADFIGASGDLVDPDRGTNFQTATYTVLGRDVL